MGGKKRGETKSSPSAVSVTETYSREHSNAVEDERLHTCRVPCSRIKLYRARSSYVIESGQTGSVVVVGGQVFPRNMDTLNKHEASHRECPLSITLRQTASRMCGSTNSTRSNYFPAWVTTARGGGEGVQEHRSPGEPSAGCGATEASVRAIYPSQTESPVFARFPADGSRRRRRRRDIEGYLARGQSKQTQRRRRCKVTCW